MDAIYALVGAILGAAICLFLWKTAGSNEAKSLRERLAEKVEQIKKADQEAETLRAQLLTESKARAKLETELEQKQEAFEEQKRTILEAEKKLSDAFANISQQALAQSAEQFLKLAKENFEKHSETATGDLSLRHKAIEELVKPLKETLDKLETQTQEIEQKRLAAYEGVTDHINRLVTETSHLSNALRKPHIRGSWGELTLRRVAESSGLVEGQDFEMQVSTDTDEGRLRPDMVVHLPNSGIIVVDSKVPLDSYLDAMKASDEESRALKLKTHAMQVRKHIQQLSSKSYWNQFETSPDFVVMFVPAESLYQAAIEQDIDLLETAFKARVVLANPMTLIALLRTVAYGMTQEKIRENALEIRNVGEKLHDAVRVFVNHMSTVGKHLSQATTSYNSAIGSMDHNLISKARQLKSLGAGANADIESPDPIEISPRLSNTPPLPDLE